MTEAEILYERGIAALKDMRGERYNIVVVLQEFREALKKVHEPVLNVIQDEI